MTKTANARAKRNTLIGLVVAAVLAVAGGLLGRDLSGAQGLATDLAIEGADAIEDEAGQ
jgi:hypothetical protein